MYEAATAQKVEWSCHMCLVDDIYTTELALSLHCVNASISLKSSDCFPTTSPDCMLKIPCALV